MALTLYKTSKFARLYQDRELGQESVGFMKATIEPMHYESVYGSGDFDTAIDLTWDAVDDSALDGYEMTRAAYQWELQTDVQAASQQVQGSVTYRDRDGTNELIVRPIQLSYYHIPTVATDLIGSAFVYTTGAATAETTKIQRTRNLGTHADVDDEIVGIASAMRWNTLDTIDSQTIWAEYSTQQQRCEIGVMFGNDAGDWTYTNDPPATTEADTQVGVLYEVDWSGVPRVYLADGTLVDPSTDDFDDSLGDIFLRDGNDNLIGAIARNTYQSHYGNHFRWSHNGSPSQTKYFWENGGTTYMHVGVNVEDTWVRGVDDVRGAMFVLTINAELESSGELLANDGWQSEYWYSGADKVGTYNIYRGFGHYFGATEYYRWAAVDRFHHELPRGASLTDAGEYANLIHYDMYYPETGRYPSDRGTYDGAVEFDTHVDVGGANQGYILDGDVNNYGSWVDSYNFTRGTADYPLASGVAHYPVDISYPMEEFLGLYETAAGNAVRITTMGNSLNGDNNYAVIDSYSNIFGKGAVLDVCFRYPDQRKPGFTDGSGKRNKRESRFFSSNMPYRLGVDDTPDVKTQDNKNRNRFS